MDMTTREKIILGMMCLTMAYGAYQLLPMGSDQDNPITEMKNSIDENRKLSLEMSKKITDWGSSQEGQYMVELAAADWTKDPFVQSIKPLKSKPPAQTDKFQASSAVKTESSFPKMAYTGFMQVGSIKIAIIDGIEYSEGDALGTTDYYVSRITAREVIIAKIKGSETIHLPLQETNQ